ncbi:unnamed protein product [Adineta steineri]|uniref:Uncharacterized protein n=1 Tax=Adineta steineri TaxID=433720 RepID=A0A814PK65_9BILA|nr:unnamed protein product [Adineta steineri]
MYRHQNNSINNLSRTIIGKILILGIIIYLVKYVMSDHTNHNSISESNSLPEVIKEIPNTIITDHQHRPLIHFSPKKNWINDPNGLVYYDTEWHLFYQYYPKAPMSINMHWGHAVSKDLITWNELLIAIPPEDDIAGIWSGSVVIDWKNITGFQKNTNIHPMIAIYTWQYQRWQEQHMAYSLDKGRTWTKYESNPVIPLYNNVSKADRLSDKITRNAFRDPKVMFHVATNSWILVLTGGDHVQFYRSIDLIHWSLISHFGHNDGSHGGTWECPDLIEFPQVKLKNQTNLWILLVSVQRGSPAGGSGMQYFIGTFDGYIFHNIQSSQTINWLDYGSDFYAGITFHNIPQYDGRHILISWMNNWQYARELPTAPLWRGQMAIPRQLQLDFNSFTKTYHLRQLPAHELYLYSKQLLTFYRRKLSSKSANMILNSSHDVYMLNTEFHNITKTTNIHIRLRQTIDKLEYTEIKYIGNKNQIEFDRSHSGNINFHNSFYPQFNMSLDKETLTTGILKLQIIVDRCSIELFINGGKYTMTALIFPKHQGYQIELSIDGEDILLNYLELMLFSM